MYMWLRRTKVFFLACACVLAWGCKKDEHLDVNPSQLWGEWVQDSDRNYHWTFNSDWTGELVHTGSVAPGDLNNGDFTWSLSNGDELEVEFKGSGELGGIDNTKQYTIKAISASALRWEDIYGRSTEFTKIR